jgi:hypothetical protein
VKAAWSQERTKDAEIASVILVLTSLSLFLFLKDFISIE